MNQMPSTKDIKLGENFKGLFVGATGNRKTASATSFYEAGPIWVADFDGKLDVCKEIFPQADIEYDIFTSSNYYKFLGILREKTDSNKYRTIVVDSYTSFTQSLILWHMDVKQGGGERKVTKAGVVVPSWDEFSAEAKDTSVLLEIMKGAKCNFILTAHPIKSSKKDEQGRVIESIATAGQKGPALVPPMFKEVYFFGLESSLDASKPPKFIVQTQPTSECFARTNLGLPAKLELSNDTNLYQLIQKNKKV